MSPVGRDAAAQIQETANRQNEYVFGGRVVQFALIGLPIQVTATSESMAQNLIEMPYDSTGADNLYYLEFSCPAATSPTPPDRLHFVLFEGNGPRGEIATVGAAAGGSAVTVPIYGVRIRSGVGGPVTWSVRAWVDGGTGLLHAEQGNPGQWSWMVLRADFTRPHWATP